MTRRKDKEEVPSEEAPRPSQDSAQDPIVHVVQHLDRDPNDPRNRPETKALPSLDD